MFPLAIFGILAGLLTWATKPKETTVGFEPDPTPRMRQRALPAPTRLQNENVAPGFVGPPLHPLEERLLCLLVLWGKDKKFPAGQKKYLNKRMLIEAAKLAVQLGLKGTARALLTNGKIPAGEQMGRRGVTVMDALIAYTRAGKNG